MICEIDRFLPPCVRPTTKVAGFAALAAAGLASGQSWEAELSNPVLSPSNPTTTVTLSIDHPPGTLAVAGVGWDVHAEAGAWSDQTMLIPHPGQTPGDIIGSSVIDISGGQLMLFGYSAEPGRIEIWRATLSVTEFLPREIAVTTETNRYRIYPGCGTFGCDPSTPAALPREAMVSVQVVPAPAVLGLLGLGALGASRRRRQPQIRRSR